MVELLRSDCTGLWTVVTAALSPPLLAFCHDSATSGTFATPTTTLPSHYLGAFCRLTLLQALHTWTTGSCSTPRWEAR